MLAVPFMPVGLSDPARSEATFLMDIAVRQSYWMQRVQDYLHWLRRVLRNGCRKERAAWADSAAGVMRALAKQMESVNGGWSQRRLVTYQVWVKEYGRLTTLLQEQKPLQDPDPTAQRRWVELQEERERLRTRWISRLKESRSLRKQQAKLSPLFKTFLDLTEGLRSAEIVAQALQPARKAALEAYRSSREWLCNAAALDPWGVETASEDPWAPSLDDLMELQAWAAFRLQLLLGAPAGRLPDKIKGKSGSPAEKGLYHARWVRHYLPSVNQLTSAAVAPPGGDEFEFVPTGCVCAGSWMFGVGANSRSAAIQTQVLAKLTSLESAQQRATLGAGIPARKDFFYLCGEQPVKGMEYLNWRELLRFCGSRARRRDRVLTPGPQAEVLAWPLSPDAEAAPHSDPLPLYDVIYEEMLACLRVADLNRQEYAGDGQEAALERVTKRSDQAVETIYQEACSIRLKPDTTHHGKKSLLSSLG